jgi:hypothetical protein
VNTLPAAIIGVAMRDATRRVRPLYFRVRARVDVVVPFYLDSRPVESLLDRRHLLPKMIIPTCHIAAQAI